MSGLIPREFVDELLVQVNLVELIDAYVPLKKRGQSYLACCPFHQEKTPSFNVIPKKHFYHCFGCGASGNAISFVMNHLHQSFVQAIDTLAAKVGLEVPRNNVAGPVKKSPALHPILQQVSVFYQQTLRKTPRAVAYLKERGVNGDMAKRYEIGYAPNAWHSLVQQFPSQQATLLSTGMLVQKEDNKTYDRYRDRIMFPIHDRQGRIIGFGGRAIDQQPKYLNSPETALFQKGRELYGLHQVIQQHPLPPLILVVEGYLDVIALAQHGLGYAVATLGTATSSYHIQLLSKYTQQIVFCFDGDKAGRQAAWRALESSLPHLDAGLSIQFVFLPDGHDPDSFIRTQGRSNFEQYVADALPGNQFFFETLLANHSLHDLSGKTQLIHAAKPYLQKIANGPYKVLLMDELARLTRIETHRIEYLLSANALPSSQAQPTMARTPLRIALALLIQHPDLNTQNVVAAVDTADPDSVLLSQLIEHLRTHPSPNTASLLEHYRDTPWFDAIRQLAVWDHTIPEHALASEWLETIAFINKKNQAVLIQQLIDKSKLTQLSPAERQTLQQMLKDRHRAKIT